MKQRECEKVQVTSRLPRKNHERFSERQVEFLMSAQLTTKDPEILAQMFNTEFGTNRTKIQVYQKVRGIKKKGLPTRFAKNSEVVVVWKKPETFAQLVRQLETAQKIISNALEFAREGSAKDTHRLAEATTLQKIKDVLSPSSSSIVN